MDSSVDKNVLNEILDRLKNLDNRMTKIESQLTVQSPISESAELSEDVEKPIRFQDEEELEFRIGQFWAAKTGILVLIVGFAFLLLLPFKELPSFLPSTMGIIIGLALFGLARMWKETFSHITGYLIGGGFVILYISTMRLYYFGAEKTITSYPVILALLIAVTAISIIISIKRNSIGLTWLGLSLGYVTAVLSDYSFFIFIMITALSVVVVLFKLKYQWNILLFYGMFMAYLTHLIWFINNPFLGKSIQAIASPEINLLFLLLYMIIFSAANYFELQDKEEDIVNSGFTMLNCAGGYGLIFFITLIITPSAVAIYHLISALVILAIAITFWVKRNSKSSTFFYAITGYVSLSVAIIWQFSEPDFFIWLCWQSLFVVSTAVWFRSKYIIVANFLIFLMIFIAFLIMSGDQGGIGISFGIVALLSARILNWKMDQLEIQTELMRNAYLVSALFIIPYSLYQIFPSGYVSLTWIGVAIIYYFLSIWLNNKKYRWMALATYFLTVIYVFVLGITSTEPLFKIVSFLVLGSALIIISLVYSKDRAKKKLKEDTNKEA
jgi:uncharacterized membrane protein